MYRCRIRIGYAIRNVLGSVGIEAETWQMSEPGSVAYLAYTTKLQELSAGVSGTKRVIAEFSSLPAPYQACWAAAEQAVRNARDAAVVVEKPSK